MTNISDQNTRLQTLAIENALLKQNLETMQITADELKKQLDTWKSLNAGRIDSDKDPQAMVEKLKFLFGDDGLLVLLNCNKLDALAALDVIRAPIGP